GIFDLFQDLTQHVVGKTQFDNLVGRPGSHAFHGEIEESMRDKYRAPVLYNERVAMIEALSKWFHIRACFTRDQDKGDSQVARVRERWCGCLVRIGLAIE